MSAHLIYRGSPANETSASLVSSVLLSLQCAFAGFHFGNYPGDFLFICLGFCLAPTIVSRPFFGTSPTRIVPADVAFTHINHILSNLDFLTLNGFPVGETRRSLLPKGIGPTSVVRDRLIPNGSGSGDPDLQG